MARYKLTLAYDGSGFVGSQRQAAKSRTVQGELEKGETAVMSIRNFGEKSLDELRQKMQEKGYMKEDSSSAE